MTEEIQFWKKCSCCKKEIPFGSKYQTCSVSTCNSKKLGLTFCSVPCWDAHLGFANHRESSAIEGKTPSLQQFESEKKSITSKEIIMNETPKKIFVRSENAAPPETDILVVVSKVKKLIQESSDFNTSQCAVEALTKIVVKECLKAIDNAKSCGRKTVMGRDF